VIIFVVLAIFFIFGWKKNKVTDELEPEEQMYQNVNVK